MTGHRCSHEAELWESLASGRWPEACGSELREHVDTCRECSDLAHVAEALIADRREGETGASIPPSGAVWWRMQMRMAREANEAAVRTVRRAHSAIVAVTIGAIVLVLATTSLLRSGWTWLASVMPKLDALAALSSVPPPLTAVILAALAFAVLTPVALYLAVAEE